MAARLAPVGSRPIRTSPLRRARETAAPLAARWSLTPQVEPAVGEIPSPTDDLAGRSSWLRRALAGRWEDLGPDVGSWRVRLVDTLAALPGDAVVFTHFVAINVVVGWAEGSDDVVVFRPGNGSCTVVDVAEDGAFTVVGRGDEAATEVR